ncbi:hypothetical protein KEM52_005081 [Ascosphaera acerosa]|nr:hypothetical protein KEM52_005081 [Ascosphaera acerosa]
MALNGLRDQARAAQTSQREAGRTSKTGGPAYAAQQKQNHWDGAEISDKNSRVEAEAEADAKRRPRFLYRIDPRIK